MHLHTVTQIVSQHDAALQNRASIFAIYIGRASHSFNHIISPIISNFVLFLCVNFALYPWNSTIVTKQILIFSKKYLDSFFIISKSIILHVLYFQKYPFYHLPFYDLNNFIDIACVIYYLKCSQIF